MDIPLVDNPRAPKPAKLQSPEKPRRILPDGWWNLSNLSGTIKGVSGAVECHDIPAHWKAAILAELVGLEDRFNFVSLDAHYHTEKGIAILHYTITPETKLI
jgi:hypothetical protein